MKDISNRPSPFERKTFDQRLSDLNALNGVKQNSIREHSNIHSLRNERFFSEQLLHNRFRMTRDLLGTDDKTYSALSTKAGGIVGPLKGDLY